MYIFPFLNPVPALETVAVTVVGSMVPVNIVMLFDTTVTVSPNVYEGAIKSGSKTTSVIVAFLKITSSIGVLYCIPSLVYLRFLNFISFLSPLTVFNLKVVF